MTSFFSLQNNINLNDAKQVNLHGAAHGLDPNLSLEEIEKIHTTVFYIKIASILLVSGISLLFGIMPYMCVKILGLANAFSGGLFMGISLFHLLPESGQAFEHFFSEHSPDSTWRELPCSFFLAFIAYASILFIEKVAFDSHSLTAHNHAHGKNEDHDDITLLYDGDHKEFIDQENNEPLYKQIQDIPDSNANNNHNHGILISNKTKNFGEQITINTIKVTKDKIRLTTVPNFNNLINHSEHSHKHAHDPVHIHNKHHDHSKEEIVDTNKNGINSINAGNANISNVNHELNVDKFVLNETENGDYLDENIDEGKHTTRPRVNTFDCSKLPINQMRKHLNGVLLQENHQQLKKKKKKKKHKKSHVLDANCEHDHLHQENSDSDIEEATLKNVVSSKGKFLSLLQARNILESPALHNRPDIAMFKASQIINRTIVRKCNSMDEDCITNLVYPCPEECVPKAEEKAHRKVSVHSERSEAHDFKPKSKFAPYILLIALSLHGLFEGIALGIQRIARDTLFLFLAILAHKWAEAFSLGIAFYKSNTPHPTLWRMILLFSIFTPIGILLGMVLLEASPILEGVFLAISAGTFLYISASEVIIEEFAITKYRYEKYLIFIAGGLFAGILAYVE